MIKDNTRRRQEIVNRATAAKEMLIQNSMEPSLASLTLHGFAFKLGARFQKTEDLIEDLFLKWDDIAQVGIHELQGCLTLYVHFVCDDMEDVP